MKQITELDAWKALKSHAESTRSHRVAEQGSYPFKLQHKGLSIDFRHQHLDATTCNLLVELARSRQLDEKINALISGDKVNTSEQRPALHTALRAPSNQILELQGRNLIQDVAATRAQMQDIATKIRNNEWYGYSGKAITDIVNIGIGGSDFGPRLCVDALADYTAMHLGYHFISDADPHAFRNTVKRLNPETTLFIVSSKSFTTKETLLNAKKAMDWYGANPIATHFIAVTAHIEKAKAFGIQTALPIWVWVGGRFSFCSAINLIGCIALGFEQFMHILDGAHDMDLHFQQAPFIENIPVMLALIGIWNINFLHIPNHLCMIYAKQLEQFVPYLQQLDMESNGKSIDIQGRALNYATSPLVFGGLGNQAQHSYFQLLCQGSHTIAADFISSKEFDGELINQVCHSKMHVLANGIHKEGNGYIPGGMPINHISLEACTPYQLGALIALYEHKIYVQGTIWNINVFDQPGVENAKQVLFKNAVVVEEEINKF